MAVGSSPEPFQTVLEFWHSSGGSSFCVPHRAYGSRGAAGVWEGAGEGSEAPASGHSAVAPAERDAWLGPLLQPAAACTHGPGDRRRKENLPGREMRKGCSRQRARSEHRPGS